MATFTSKSSGDWEDTGLTTWNELNSPIAGDTVTIQNGHTVTLDVPGICAILTIDDGGVLTDATNNQGLTVSGATYVTGTLICGSGTMSFGSGLTGLGYALIINNTGTFTGGSGTHTAGSFCGGTGSNVTNTSGVLTLNGENTSAGAVQIFSNAMTFNDGNGTVICTYTGDDTIFDMGAETHYNLIINAAATIYTLRDPGTIANNLTITAGTVDTGTDDLTVTNLTNVSGTLTCNASTCSFGSGVTNNFALTVSGTFNGGTGIHTMGSVFIDNGTATFTSGVTTIDSRQLSGVAFGAEYGTFNHGSGTVVFTMANYQLLYDFTYTLKTFYNLIINKASNLVQFSNTSGFFIIVANDFTITSGEFDTSEKTGGASRFLTVSGNTIIAGTLTCNASTLIFAGNITNNGTLNCGTSSIVVNGTAQSLIGSMTFNNFTKAITSTDELTFDNTATYTFGGNITLNGTLGNLLSLTSDITGNDFDFVMSAGAVKTNLDYLAIKDSDASGSDASQKPIAPTNSTDVSGNTDWFGAAPVATTGKGGFIAKRIILMGGI